MRGVSERGMYDMKSAGRGRVDANAQSGKGRTVFWVSATCRVRKGVKLEKQLGSDVGETPHWLPNPLKLPTEYIPCRPQEA